MTENDEPILKEENRRYTMYPIIHTNIWNLYQTQLACFWKPAEIDFSKDLEDFETLSPNEQFYIKRVLAFFSSSDGLINFNIGKRFLNDIKIMEGLVCYSFQMMMEYQHSETYSIMLDNLVKNPKERTDLLNAIETVDSVKKLGEWALRWSNSELSFAHRLIIFAVFEGVLFSGAFASIFWIKKFKSAGKLFLQGLVKSNEFIARDEGLHVNYATELYKMLIYTKLSENEVFELVEEGTQVSKNFMSEALPVHLIGMNSNSMSEYLEYIADRLLVDLGYRKKYDTKNPYEWMQTIGMTSCSNFFESRSSDYGACFTSLNIRQGNFEMLEDF
jgi:ribonucleoside-diphosphate reductase beta chain